MVPMPRIQSPRYQGRILWRSVLWGVGWAGGLWGAGLFMRAGNFILGLLLVLLSLGLLWGRAGISSISALVRFSVSPSTTVMKVADPFSWECYLLGYNLFLTIISAIFVAFPMGKHLGASPISRPGLVWVWVFGPVFEELSFRLPLKYTKINLTISALLLTLFTVRRLLLKFGILGLATLWLWSAVFAVLVASVVFALLRTERVQRLTGKVWLNHFRCVLYVSCFTFGLLHIFNFRFPLLSSESLVLVPLMVLPQIISGFVLAFARIRLGMIWCIVLHAANNFLAFRLFPIRLR
jgi:hypothetical protein